MKFKRYLQDSNKRKLFKKIELTQRLYKLLSVSFNMNLFKLLISKFLYNSSCHFIPIKNFCIVSGRSSGVYTKFKVSRIVLRELSTQGYFFGLKKAS